MKLTLDNHIFRAEIIPEIGGNVISLRHRESNTALLREPPGPAELKRFPEQFGIPVLFPPNRIADGRFVFEGRECQLPVNEAAMHNHLHGLVVGKPWELLNADQVSAELQFDFSARDPEYEGFPFAFTLKRRIELTPSGLRDTMTVTNHGEWNMPLGLGYHTTFPEPLQIRMGTDGQQIGIGERYLPTGRSKGWQDLDPRNWFDPHGRDIGFHARAKDLEPENGPSLHGAELLYPAGLLRYATDRKFSFWYTWNRRGKADFVSLEPVSWMADALNQKDPLSAGVRKLASGEEAVFGNELLFLPRR
ncbi:MAG: aldose 1-epimerase [Lentisphaeria bacterium]|nr:aldose 1-epimerase [Lentisphaeria bacterium]